MSSRAPSKPPAIEGFDYIRLLGSGGFADVFLYQQRHPRREVAVKVLLPDRAGTAAAEGFTEEANLMAQLANHPSIVSVYEADVTGDGRPYLVMEYCPLPNLQVQHRQKPFSEAETLRVGVQIAAAVETAHRAGILHRDIKPANILVDSYRHPKLTDFGISAATTSEMAGMSIPWSPPESFRSPPDGYPSSDVYSLAATLYTLLTNRSPFEVPGASNSEIDVMARIQRSPLPELGRADVSPQLVEVLQRAMAKDPSQRYATARDLAYELQRVQTALGMQSTHIDLIEEQIDVRPEDDADDRTSHRSVTEIDAQAPISALPTTGRPLVDDGTVTRQGATNAGPTRVRGATDATRLSAPGPAPAPIAPPPLAPVLEATVARPVTVEPTVDPLPADEPTSRRGRIVAVVIGAAALVAIVVVAAAIMLAPHGADTPAVEATPTAAPLDADQAATAPKVTALAGVAGAGGIVFTWTNPQPQTGDVYLWRAVVPGETHAFAEVDATTVTVPADASGRACIEVVLRRADGSSAADGTQKCAP